MEFQTETPILVRDFSSFLVLKILQRSTHSGMIWYYVLELMCRAGFRKLRFIGAYK